jgi:hypothetical protein
VALAVAVVYAAPALIAAHRRHRRAERIALLNLALGWTVVGWLVLLVHVLLPGRPRSRTAGRTPRKRPTGEEAAAGAAAPARAAGRSSSVTG